MDVEVRYINRTKGRGVFATREFLEKEVVYLEAPLVSHRNLDVTKDGIPTCSYTMKSFLPPESWESPFDNVMQSVMEKNNLSQNPWIHCEHCKDDLLCGEKYMSNYAKKKAWSEYHKILCTRNSPDHPVVRLTKESRTLGKTNPLFILRMMAMIVQRMRDITWKDPTKERIQVKVEAFEPFSMFISNQEKGPLELETVEALKTILGTDEYDDVVSLHTYRELNGAILRNAQALNPVSDVHLYLNSLLPHKQQELIDLWPSPDVKTPTDFIKSDYMVNKCIMGTGLFLIANSTNHSCSPNLFSTSSTNNYYVTMIAKRKIKKGEELTISYINEEMSYLDRQAKLKEMYFFECKCEKCHYRW
eukprot:TRINITY_DN1015_c0_g3_i1.p1 TRINITY_DN1015_c0_g3~~TRINITY_DN1015_c0_g3_i1.p1  ORF type:complete len:360 (+),score=66.90 TRINITY_DN1015_c0_g3_i1:474-1553(+)